MIDEIYLMLVHIVTIGYSYDFIYTIKSFCIAFFSVKFIYIYLFNNCSTNFFNSFSSVLVSLSSLVNAFVAPTFAATIVL